MSSRLLTLMRKRGGFNPLSLNPTLWALPENSFSDNGVTPAVDNDPVYFVNDASPEGWDLTQVVLANRPLYKSAGYWTFDGTGDRLTVAESIGGLDAATIITVAKHNNTTASQATINCNVNTLGVQLGSNAKFILSGTGINGSYAFTSTDWNISVIRYDGSGSNNAERLRAYENGGTQKTLSFTGTIPATLAAGSGEICIGGINHAPIYHDGDIAEVLIVPSTLTDTQLNAYGNYLVSKYPSLSLSWTDI